MQLWKKNFLITFMMFLLIIYGSLLLLHGLLYRNELEQWISRAVSEEKGIALFLREIQTDEGEASRINLSSVFRSYMLSGVKLRVEQDGRIKADLLPADLPNDKPVQIIEHQNISYVLIQDRLENAGSVTKIAYMESMAPLQQNQQRRALFMAGMGILLSAVVGGMLYFTMKRINRPVSRIAHELRTPLTGIQGYAQYLMLGNLSEEDRFFAAQQMEQSAREMNDIVEKLLIMGGVREGRVLMQKIDLASMLNDIQSLYPYIEVKCTRDIVQGDRTLVRCMLENLIQNAAAGGSQVRVSADAYRITVWNDGQAVSGKKLKWMNRSQGTPASYTDRHGFGISLCHDIAGVHGWKLFYRSSEVDGTTAEILL